MTAPLDFNVVRTNLYNWAIANIPSGMPVIYLYPNAPRPQVDYVSLYISTITQIGWDWTEDPTDNTGISNMVGDREFTLQAQAYGGDPMTVLQNLRTSLQKQSVLDSLRVNGIVFVNWFAINDVTELVDSRFEQRASMDILFRIADVYTDNLGVIDNVVLQEIYHNPSGNIVYNETFTIPPL
jgi:hypothetical protein